MRGAEDYMAEFSSAVRLASFVNTALRKLMHLSFARVPIEDEKSVVCLFVGLINHKIQIFKRFESIT